MSSRAKQSTRSPIWWICDCCGREERSLFRPERCLFDRLGKHPPLRPMGSRFLEAASSAIPFPPHGLPNARAHFWDLVHEVGMSRHALGPMLLSLQIADEDQQHMPPAVPNPGGAP